MDLNSNSEMTQDGELDDISLDSKSICSDISYDCIEMADAKNTSIAENVIKTIIQQDSSPSYTRISAVTASIVPKASRPHHYMEVPESRLNGFLFRWVKNLVTQSSPTRQLPVTKHHGGEMECKKWLLESQMTTGDSDIDSVLSDTSVLNSDVEVSGEEESGRLNAQDHEECDDTVILDVELRRLRSEIEAQCGKMILIMENAPNSVDTGTSAVISQQLRECLRDIAAMFGDDIAFLNDMPKGCNRKATARRSEFSHLRNLLEIERTKAKKEKSSLLARLQFTIAHHEMFYQKKDFEFRQKIAALRAEIEGKNQIIQNLSEDDVKYSALLEKKHEDVIGKHEEQKTNLELKHENDVGNTARDMQRSFKENKIRYRSVKNEYNEIVQIIHAVYRAILAEKDEERMDYKDAMERVQENHDNFVAEIIKKHDRDLLKNTNHFQTIIADMIKAQDGKDLKINYHDLMDDRHEREIQEQNFSRREQQIKESARECRLSDLDVEDRELEQATNLAQDQSEEQTERNTEAKAVSHTEHSDHGRNNLHPLETLSRIPLLDAQPSHLMHRAGTDGMLEEVAEAMVATSEQQSASIVQETNTSLGFQAGSAPKKAAIGHVDQSTVLQMEYEEMVDCETDTKLPGLCSLNRKHSHEQEIREVDSIIEQVKNLKQQLQACEVKIMQYDQIFAMVQQAITTRDIELERYFEECDASMKNLARFNDEIDSFISCLCDLQDLHVIVDEVTNNYADHVIAGEAPDLQEEWDKLIDSMDRTFHGPYDLMDNLFERIEVIRIKELNNGGICAKPDADLSQTATMLKNRRKEIEKLRSNLEYVLEDNQKLHEALAEARKNQDDACQEFRDMENHVDDLEILLEDDVQYNFKMLYQKLEDSQIQIKNLTEVVRLSTSETESAVNAEQCDYIDESSVSDKIHLPMESQLENCKNEDTTGALRDELRIAEEDISELQMVVFITEQRAGVAEAELRSIRKGIEAYMKDVNAAVGIKIHRVTGHGVCEALETLFASLATDRQQLGMDLTERHEKETKLVEIEED